MGQDRHCYPPPHDNVLINTFGITNNKDLNRKERDETQVSIRKLLSNPVTGSFDLKHLQATHRAIFSSIYPWAGEIRAIDIDRMAKAEPLLNGGTVGYSRLMFLKDFTEKSLTNLRNIDFGASDERTAAELADKITEVWVAHPFREGNTRTISTFLSTFAKERGFELDKIELNKTVDKITFRDSLVLAYGENYQSLNKRIINARNRAIEKENIQEKGSVKIELEKLDALSGKYVLNYRAQREAGQYSNASKTNDTIKHLQQQRQQVVYKEVKRSIYELAQNPTAEYKEKIMEKLTAAGISRKDIRENVEQVKRDKQEKTIKNQRDNGREM